MSQSRWMTRAVLAVAGALTLGSVAACGGTITGSTGSGTPGAPGTSAPATAHSGPTTTAPAKVQVTDAVAQNLCDQLRPQLSDWRVQGPSLGRVALNITVHQWAAGNGGFNLTMLGDKGMIDRLTTQHCSDVRDQALQALELPDLAAGIAF